MDEIRLTAQELRKLFGAASGDAALLLLYLRAGGDERTAAETLRLGAERTAAAGTILRQMGLIVEAPSPAAFPPSEGPQYTEEDVRRETDKADSRFPLLVGETQRLLGRVISTQELKILLSVYDYLRLPPEVISVLVTYCIQRSRSRKDGRMPSMRNIEREAYRWADAGIDSLEQAAAYMQRQLERLSAVGKIRRVLQISDRRLTTGEENYVKAWLEMGFGEDEIALAYEKTCMNTGGMKWAYCNSILKSWHSQNLLTVEQIRAGDRAPQKPACSAPAAAAAPADDFEREAVARLGRKEGAN